MKSVLYTSPVFRHRFDLRCIILDLFDLVVQMSPSVPFGRDEILERMRKKISLVRREVSILTLSVSHDNSQIVKHILVALSLLGKSSH